MTTLTKRCRICEKDVDTSLYQPRASAKDGLRSECKPCARMLKQSYREADLDRIREMRRANYYKHRDQNIEKVRIDRFERCYGITVTEYDAMSAAQNNLCKICESPAKSKRLCVDHDHHTGKVRGLLCIQCNSALGKFGDNEAGLLKAIQYLRGE